MRIGIDATIIYGDRPTGLAIFSLNVIKQLAKLHDDLVVWTAHAKALEIDPRNIREVIPSSARLGRYHFLMRALWVEARLPALIEREGIDVLWTTVPNALKKAPCPHVISVFDLIPLTFPSDTQRIVTWNFRHRLGSILENADAIVTTSQATGRDLEHYYSLSSEKIHNVSAGYDAHHFRPVSVLDSLSQFDLLLQPYILYVGNASPRKNLITLVRAFARIADRIPHCLVLAGAKTPGERTELENCARTLALGERLRLLDYVAYHDLPVLYSGADLFVYLSHYEGFGLPVLEAMACGTPVLTADKSSLPEVAGDAGAYVAPDNEGEIASRMCELLLDNNRREAMASAGIERAGKFSWQLTAKRLLDILGGYENGGPQTLRRQVLSV